MQRGKYHYTYNINKGIVIAASRARKWGNASLKTSLPSLLWVICRVSGKTVGVVGLPKTPSTSWRDDCVRSIFSHFLKSPWKADDVARLSPASDAYENGTLWVSPLSSSPTEVLGALNQLALLPESSFWVLPLKHEILKGLILDTQKQGGPTLETINKPFIWRQIQGREHSIHACFCIRINHQGMELNKLIEYQNQWIWIIILIF